MNELKANMTREEINAYHRNYIEALGDSINSCNKHLAEFERKYAHLKGSKKYEQCVAAKLRQIEAFWDEIKELQFLQEKII